jgi:hypothetical protein
MAENEDHLLLLGEIKGKLDLVIDNQVTSDARVEQRLDSIDERLRAVEIKAAVNGAVSGAVTGGVISVGISLLIESLKHKIGLGGN